MTNAPDGWPQTISYPADDDRPSRGASERVAPHVVVLFRACGDLARRKLLPGLAHLASSSLAPDIRVVGTSLEDHDDASFRIFARQAVEEFGSHRLTSEQWEAFSSSLAYVPQSAGPTPSPPRWPPPRPTWASRSAASTT